MISSKRKRVHEHSSRWNMQLSILFLRVVTPVYRRSNELKKHHPHTAATTRFTTCPLSQNSLYVSKGHRHRGVRVSPLSTACA